MAVPSCYANPNPMFQRAMRLVSDITNSSPAVITTSFAHDYETGDIVRLLVPPAYGMIQLDNYYAEITVLSPDTFSMDIDSTRFDAFTTPPDPSPRINKCAQVLPMGEINSKLSSATQNVL